MDDAILNGTEDSNEQMDVVIPKFQIRMNQNNFAIDVVRACRNNRFDDLEAGEWFVS